MKSLLLTRQLRKGEFYDFDYDSQIIEHEKYDAKRTYKHTIGYFPGVGAIGDKIVYIENRDGNANVKTVQAETPGRAYRLLKDNGIKINRSRIDATSYGEDIVKAVAENSRLFSNGLEASALFRYAPQYGLPDSYRHDEKLLQLFYRQGVRSV
ncbi:MAG: hypothetical protein LBU37_10910 [Tannerellaceae bacterium]|nr:hypothetical protein [Tannerellaceae bacterium]